MFFAYSLTSLLLRKIEYQQHSAFPDCITFFLPHLLFLRSEILQTVLKIRIILKISKFFSSFYFSRINKKLFLKKSEFFKQKNWFKIVKLEKNILNFSPKMFTLHLLTESVLQMSHYLLNFPTQRSF